MTVKHKKCNRHILFLCFVLQIFVWTRGSFTLFQTLDFEGDIVSVSPFTHAAVPHLLVCIEGQNVSCVLLRWTNRRFQNLQPLKLKGRAIQAEAINTGVDKTLLLVVMEGDVSFLFFFCLFSAFSLSFCKIIRQCGLVFVFVFFLEITCV